MGSIDADWQWIDGECGGEGLAACGVGTSTWEQREGKQVDGDGIDWDWWMMRWWGSCAGGYCAYTRRKGAEGEV